MVIAGKESGETEHFLTYPSHLSRSVFKMAPQSLRSLKNEGKNRKKHVLLWRLCLTFQFTEENRNDGMIWDDVDQTDEDGMDFIDFIAP